MYDLKGLGKRIEELRKQKGMTQENLAERLGVTNQAVSKWENSLCYPDIELIPTLCAIFEISLDDIFGKIKKDVSNLSFPQVYKGLNLVATFANIACYSDKEIIQTGIQGQPAPSTIEFKDGSIAELSSRRVVNRGPGKIILRALDDIVSNNVSGINNYELLKKLEEKKLMPNHLDIEYGKVKKLECAIPNGNCVIEKADGDKTLIFVDGYPEFIDLLEFEYHQGEQTTLIVKYDQHKRDKLGNEMNKWDISKNNVKIALAYDGEKLEGIGVSVDGSGDIKLEVPSIGAGLNINGSGNIDAPVSFDALGANINGSGNIKFINGGNLGATINGSGNIDFNNADNCGLAINGSGDIKFNNAGNCGASINGSGDISANIIGNLGASINGSGDMKFHECDIISIEIHGSGDFDTDKANKSVAIKIHGSGDVNIRSGEVETFDIFMDNGEVNARGVTTDKANIEIPNHGRVEIGRVKIESIEKCGDNAEVIIHQRG